MHLRVPFISFLRAYVRACRLAMRFVHRLPSPLAAFLADRAEALHKILVAEGAKMSKSQFVSSSLLASRGTLWCLARILSSLIDLEAADAAEETERARRRAIAEAAGAETTAGVDPRSLRLHIGDVVQLRETIEDWERSGEHTDAVAREVVWTMRDRTVMLGGAGDGVDGDSRAALWH